MVQESAHPCSCTLISRLYRAHPFPWGPGVCQSVSQSVCVSHASVLVLQLQQAKQRRLDLRPFSLPSHPLLSSPLPPSLPPFLPSSPKAQTCSRAFLLAFTTNER